MLKKKKSFKKVIKNKYINKQTSQHDIETNEEESKSEKSDQTKENIHSIYSENSSQIIKENEEDTNIIKSTSTIASTSITTTKRRNKSIIWEHFDKFKDDKEVEWAKCKHCL
jgi:hypothetical protein